MKHHIIAYSGKVVVMDYISEKKREFNVACMRIIDNGANGYILTPKGDIYAVEQGKRTARPVKENEEKAAALVLLSQNI